MTLPDCNYMGEREYWLAAHASDILGRIEEFEEMALCRGDTLRAQVQLPVLEIAVTKLLAVYQALTIHRFDETHRAHS